MTAFRKSLIVSAILSTGMGLLFSIRMGTVLTSTKPAEMFLVAFLTVAVPVFPGLALVCYVVFKMIDGGTGISPFVRMFHGLSAFISGMVFLMMVSELAQKLEWPLIHPWALMHGTIVIFAPLFIFLAYQLLGWIPLFRKRKSKL